MSDIKKYIEEGIGGELAIAGTGILGAYLGTKAIDKALQGYTKAKELTSKKKETLADKEAEKAEKEITWKRRINAVLKRGAVHEFSDRHELRGFILEGKGKKALELGGKAARAILYPAIAAAGVEIASRVTSTEKAVKEREDAIRRLAKLRAEKMGKEPTN